MKDLTDYTLEEFQNMENFGESSFFDSVIIVPTKDLHDSGYRCMKFILVRRGELVGCVSGWSDVVHPNGIGNYGKHLQPYLDVVPYMGLSMDCLPGSNCIRLMMGGLCKTDDFIGSDFQFYLLKYGE